MHIDNLKSGIPYTFHLADGDHYTVIDATFIEFRDSGTSHFIQVELGTGRRKLIPTKEITRIEQ
jgi:hypothetical protein